MLRFHHEITNIDPAIRFGKIGHQALKDLDPGQLTEARLTHAASLDEVSVAHKERWAEEHRPPFAGKIALSPHSANIYS